MKRHLRLQEQKIKERLEKYEKTRAEHRKARHRKDYKTVGIVGYTNAGKSSLMNALTHKGVLSENKLFATLGTSVGKMFLPSEDGYGREVLVNDTIGFIRDLPPELIQAFSSTLEDSVESELLLHVIDANDPKIADKIDLVDSTLAKIGAKQQRLYVFNKIDLVSKDRQDELEQQFTDLAPVFISAEKGIGLDDLKKAIQSALGVSPKRY